MLIWTSILVRICKDFCCDRICIGYKEAKISIIIIIQLSVLCAHKPCLFSGLLISMHYVMITKLYCSDYNLANYLLCICILIETCITNTAGATINYTYNKIK